MAWLRVLGVLGVVASVFVAVWWAHSMNSQQETSSSKSNHPILTKLEPVKVGYLREIQLVSGQTHKIKTLSMRPALFEIENFLSEEECDDIIFMAKTQGLESSKTVVSSAENVNDTLLQDILSRPEEAFKNLDANNNGVIDISELASGMSFLADIMITDELVLQLMDDLDLDADKDKLISQQEYVAMLQPDTLQRIINHTNSIKLAQPTLKVRVSNTAFLNPMEHVGKKKLFEDLKNRIQLVSGLPRDVIWTSEDLQVLRYDESGHYHCHYDSEEEEEHPNITCCHYITQWSTEKCLPCRYMTFFYYLNEPEEGGETAFPIADNESIAAELIRGDQHHLCDLSNYCHKAKIAYKPKRGTALFWYNHQLNQQTGWIGKLDKMSYHGGCDVIKGTKWAANNWINAGQSRELDVKSWADYKQYIEDYDIPDEKSTKGGQENEEVEPSKENENEKAKEVKDERKMGDEKEKESEKK